ncbi:methionine biosynthesis protein MetW [Thiothrix caldifontis]|jgi:2-polyprenyl-3-methyl-5-hydroxy-6-metoxy-1,4-benzoquinol methylase|uniref:Methionine biosynthesis protein MetW n=1 Tax=Thiothrix caldifontis TaxID=525918 RepID=A0A1H3VHD0_9GAMM|nr:class I SAM-dependent methyltransferase [Thiothrix caldifontis]SDZ74217.1 methionine biosynthesis protein MetW [Thiothrix caldifontis]
MTQATANSLDDNHSHSQIVRRVPRYAHVLELGCGDGSMSRLLRERCEANIIGIDHNPDIVWQAQRYCDYVFTEDLDDPQSLDALEDEKFDVITLVDVLEHLKHPESLLRRLKPLLLDEGQVLISIPNIAHASVRLELLNGHFDYEPAGILDDTHLKFFTVESVQALLADAGFAVNEIDYTWHDLPDEVIKQYLQAAGLESTPAALAKFHEPEAVAYQFIIAGSPIVEKSPKGKVRTIQHRLKPIDASWQTWGKVHTELALAQAELERVYATRSWQMLRRGATAWRSIQARFMHE